MARPRAGNFQYDDREFEQLLTDASELLSAGAHGIVFGCLDRGSAIAVDDVQAVVRLAENSETVFHRAFDETPDANASLDALIEAGVSRVLTSGHARTAIEGAGTIAALMQRAAGRITVLAGGSVRASNVRALVERTHVAQVHARGSERGVIASLRAAVG